jgi:hypothetical protein
MNTIQLITAFYDIDENPTSSPKINDYFLSLRAYLNIPYNIIAFVDERYIHKIPKNTNSTIIPINEDWLNEHSKSWKRLENIHKHFHSLSIHTRFKIEYESSIKNNLINFAKTDFVNYAIENKLSEASFVCWSDFDYFKSVFGLDAKLYPIAALDISKFDINKMNFVSKKELIESDYDIFGTLINPRETISGSFFCGPVSCWKKFYELFNSQLDEFLYNGILDNDKHVYLRCTRAKREFFKIHVIKNTDPLNYFQSTFIDRYDLIGHYISRIKLKNMVQIGMRENYLSKFVLNKAPNCKIYFVFKKDIYTTGLLDYYFPNRVMMMTSDISAELDFIYIDEDCCSYEKIFSYIMRWYPKLKPGGIFMCNNASDEDEELRNLDGNISIRWNFLEIYCGVIKAFRDYCNIHGLVYYKIQNQILMFKSLQ